MRRAIGCALLLFAIGASMPAQELSLYERLALCAEDPLLRPAVCSIILDDLHEDGRVLAERYRTDENPTVRSRCYKWLIESPSDRQCEWLLAAFLDEATEVQAHAILSAEEVPEWTPAVRSELRRILRTCSRGHLFQLAAEALVRRGGSAWAEFVFDAAQNRGSDWWPYALSALAMHPSEAYRAVFEEAAVSEGRDAACLGQRSLAILNGQKAGVPACRTVAEYRALWRESSFSTNQPNVIGLDQLLVNLREKRVIILGELHAAIAGRATQISVLADLAHAKNHQVVLIHEEGVREYQEPVLAAAKQYRIPMRTLESESLALHESAAMRDEFARNALVAMVQTEPETTFVVCYGENHRRSFHKALADAQISVASVSLSGRKGMLASAMRATKGRIQGRCFAYGDDVYYAPAVSYATLFGAPGLDKAFVPQ